MLELDGSAAGGQFLRTGLALSALTGTSVRFEHVRGERPDPGLGHQHLAAVTAMADLCDATVDGATLGAETVTFEPGAVDAEVVETGAVDSGTIEVDVGTAGSLSLVFDALLPLGAVADEPFSVTATGGTEVAWSPPLSSLQRVKLPLLRPFGVLAALERERTGFYPAGGGAATLHVAPATPEPIDCRSRGDGRGADVVSIASAGLADSDVAERQAAAVCDRLDDVGLSVRHETATSADTESPGSAVLVALVYDEARAGFSALGEPGKPAETVGREAADAAVAFHESGDAVVDRHLADQLLPYLAIAGGHVRAPALTDHVETSVELLAAFGLDVDVTETSEGVMLSVDEPLALAEVGAG